MVGVAVAVAVAVGVVVVVVVAMTHITNHTGLPLPLVAALRDDGYSRGEGVNISATGLISPPRKQYLENLYAEQLEEDAADMAAILIGKAVHAYIAAKATGELSDKKRLTMAVNGWVVSGQTDHVDEGWVVDGGKIVDYKTTSVNEWKFGLKEEREQQLNIYAELLRSNGYAVAGLAATLIFKDWSATRASYEKDYPPNSIVEVEVPLWDEEKDQAYILERVLLHQQAQEYDVQCTDEERWLRLKYAVVKGENKRATKVFEGQEEAEEFAAANPTYRVEVRGGEPLRCLHYCVVGKMGLCQQYLGDQ